MGDVNDELKTFADKPIHGGVHLFLAAPIDISLPSLAKLRIPLIPGAELLYAGSVTNHEGTEVNWLLPATGLLFPPVLHLKGSWYLRPAVGPYWLGKPWAARVAITDRNGRLELTDFKLGGFLALGWQKKVSPKWSLDAEGGYRVLNFTDVRLRPVGGFPPTPGASPAQAGTLPGSVNFSGLFIRVGFTMDATP